MEDIARRQGSNGADPDAEPESSWSSKDRGGRGSRGLEQEKQSRSRREEEMLQRVLASLSEEVDEVERSVHQNLHTLDSWRPPTPVQGSHEVMAEYEMQVGGSSSSISRPEGESSHSNWSQATSGLMRLILEEPFRDLKHNGGNNNTKNSNSNLNLHIRAQGSSSQQQRQRFAHDKPPLLFGEEGQQRLQLHPEQQWRQPEREALAKACAEHIGQASHDGKSASASASAVVAAAAAATASASAASATATATASATAVSSSEDSTDATRTDPNRPLGAKALFRSGIVQALIQDRSVLRANLKDYDLALNSALEELTRLRARHSAAGAASQLRRGLTELGERLVRVREAQEDLQRENLELVAAHEELLDLSRSALLDARADEALEGLVECLASENEMLWKMVEVSRIVSRISAPPLSLQAPSPGAKRHRPSLGSRSARSSAGSSPASPDAGFAERDRTRFSLPNPAIPDVMGPGTGGNEAGSPAGLGSSHLCVDEAEMTQDGAFDNPNGLFGGSSIKEPELRAPPSPESPEQDPACEDDQAAGNAGRHHHHHHGGAEAGGGDGQMQPHGGHHRHHGGHHFDAHSHRFGYALLQQHSQQQQHFPESDTSSGHAGGGGSDEFSTKVPPLAPAPAPSSLSRITESEGASLTRAVEPEAGAGAAFLEPQGEDKYRSDDVDSVASGDTVIDLGQQQEQQQQHEDQEQELGILRRKAPIVENAGSEDLLPAPHDDDDDDDPLPAASEAVPVPDSASASALDEADDAGGAGWSLVADHSEKPGQQADGDGDKGISQSPEGRKKEHNDRKDAERLPIEERTGDDTLGGVTVD